MMPMLSFFFATLACFAMAAQQTGSLKEVEQILKNVAAQRTQKFRPQGFQYHPRYSGLGLKQRNQDREENDRSYDSAQSMEFYHQLENMRIEKQLEDDLQQALMSESNRICKATGRCGCSGGRCGREYRAVDRTINEMEQLLKELNKDINKQRNRNFRSDEDRRQKYNNRIEKYNLDQQLYEKDRQQNNRRLKYNDRKLRQNDRRLRQTEKNERQKEDDRRQEYDEERQEYDDRRQRQEQDDRLQELEDRRQEYKVQRQDLEDDNNANDDDIIKNLGIETKTYKNSDFDIVVLDVPESNEFQNRDDNIKIVDITESAIEDLLQQRKTSRDKKEQKDRRVGNLNLEDFVAYYKKIKEELTNGLMKYVKGSGDGSYLVPLLPYQKKQIENLKNLQVKWPKADDDLKAKIVELLFGSLSNIKILPHSKDSQTIYIPQQVMDAVPSVIRQNALRSRLFPLTFYQKQRQRNIAPRHIILNHSWRRNNRQAPNYGIPFNLQVQGLGQVNQIDVGN